jgi:hypothetical protein
MKIISPVVSIPIITFLALTFAITARCDETLVAHWPLIVDGRDISGNQLHATPHDVDFSAKGHSQRAATAAAFDGRSSRLEVPDDKLLQLGGEDFTIAAWVYTDGSTDDVPGDIISKYERSSRRGFHLALKSNAGVTFSQPNCRQLQFGVDDDHAPNTWTDCGRPGNSLLAFALCSFDGHLYAGTCEPGRNESGRVYRYTGDQKWIDCGSPDKSNAVTALATFNGQLYAATGKYRVAGSSLPESENNNLGGRVFRFDPPAGWIDCGRLAGVEAVGGLTVFQDNLYATSLYNPPGFYRYDGKQNWQECELPKGPADDAGESKYMRVEAIAPFNGFLYGTTYDGGRVFRFDGRQWRDCGQLADNTQTYSFAIYNGRLYVGTWPSGRVYRFEEPGQWQDCGRLGDELEVMGMLVHNGRLIAGTLPLAEMYQFDGRSNWQKLASLDNTADVRYRRAWCLAEHNGQVFCSTLPSGKVYSWHAGQIAMANEALPSGWRHIAATRAGNTLRLFVDGQQIAEKINSETTAFNLTNGEALQIGFGPNDYFNGRLSDIRLYRRALKAIEIADLAKNSAIDAK